MAFIALKVDVDTLRGTREGVPRLLRVLAARELRASFLFSLGPDHTGWALRRAFRPGFVGKVARTSVLAHYGLRTLLYGVLLPAPDIGRRAAEAMRIARRAGHECGIHAWDHVVWHDAVRRRNPAWTRRQLGLARQRYLEIFGTPPDTFGAAGWQSNEAALRQLDDWGLRYASDGRGPRPYRVRTESGLLQHVQMPTSLPTFDELIGRDGTTGANVARALLARTASNSQDQVFTLHAELEGGLLAPAFEALLDGWKAQGHRLGTLGDGYRRLDLDRLPEAPLRWGTIEGRSGELLLGPG